MATRALCSFTGMLVAVAAALAAGSPPTQPATKPAATAPLAAPATAPSKPMVKATAPAAATAPAVVKAAPVATAPAATPALAKAPGTAPTQASAPTTAPVVPLPAPRAQTKDFLLDVIPVINKVGCNAVACHGSTRGKGGLVLSMFGADPRADYDALVKADGGRRVDLVDPAKSLFLMKACGAVEHGGKERLQGRLAPATADYKALAAWVADGAPLSRPGAPTLASVVVLPTERIFGKGGTQPLTVTATFSDGSKKDVSAAALYSTSDGNVAGVDERGVVTANNAGEAIVVASYLRQPAVFRATVPQALRTPFPAQVPSNGRIDDLVIAKLRTLNIPPSDLCNDPEFLRRVYLDVTGTLPTADEVRAFLSDQDPRKRSKVIDKLLNSEEFADYWAMKWADLFRIKSEFPVNLWPNAVQAYHRWVRVSIANNKPYDQFVRELLTATGSNFRDPPANFYRGFLKHDPQNVAEVAALTFMGARVGCARCHGHPTEAWTLDDNLAFSAFFAQVKYKSTMEWKEELVLLDTRQVMRHPRTGEVIKPRLLDGQVVDVTEGQDARVKFAEWLTSPQNPWFARAIANRTWFWLIGRGIVHEPDDMRPSNPPENPQLLDYMAQELVDHKFDLKHIYRLILNSRTYQLSARTSEGNKADVAHFSHYYIKRLGAETLLDAIGQITGKWDTYSSIIPEPFVVMPPAFRATHLADGSISLPFLELFGRPPRDTAYESDRDLELYLRQTLHLLNSSDVQNKINNSPWLAGLIKDAPDDATIIDQVYLATVNRFPKQDERNKILGYIAAASSQAASQSLPVELQAATEALAKLRADIAKAGTDLDAATRESKAADAAVANAKTPEAKAEATKAAAEKKARVPAAKAARDKLAAAEKPAVARVTDANKRVEAAKAEARQRRVQAIQDLVWALLNTKEFVFNH